MRGDVQEAVVPCKICGSATTAIGSKIGSFRPETFLLRRCLSCSFVFVANPWTDYAAIYSADYYAGTGADPLVDYQFELDHPELTIRNYEWRGILAAVGSLIPITASTRWLDFGCGGGGLVRYCRLRNLREAYGFEEGAIQTQAAAKGIPFLSKAELDRRLGTFDVITAIEVIEHVERPLEVLRRIRSLLKPGGLFFYTTGNAAPQRRNLPAWRYVVPEIHISFYEPETLRRALLAAGFRPESRGYLPGFTDIIRFKILKNLRIRRRSRWHDLLPWPVIARLVNWRHAVTAHPIGWAGERPDGRMLK